MNNLDSYEDFIEALSSRRLTEDEVLEILKRHSNPNDCGCVLCQGFLDDDFESVPEILLRLQAQSFSADALQLMADNLAFWFEPYESGNQERLMLSLGFHPRSSFDLMQEASFAFYRLVEEFLSSNELIDRTYYSDFLSQAANHPEATRETLEALVSTVHELGGLTDCVGSSEWETCSACVGLLDSSEK